MDGVKLRSMGRKADETQIGIQTEDTLTRGSFTVFSRKKLQPPAAPNKLKRKETETS